MRSSEGRNGIFNFMAFVGFIIIALLEVLSLIDSLITFGPVILNLLNTIKNVCVLVVVGVFAWRFVADKGKGLKITYFIALAVFVVFTVLMWVVQG